MDMFTSEEAVNLLDEEQEMRDKLKQYNIDEFRQDVLILRFVYGLTFEEIANELHSPSPQTVFASCKTALNLLKERGYK